MIEKDKVRNTMLDGSLTHQRRQTLAWDSQTTRARNAGRYIRERSGAPYNTSRWHKLAKAFIEDHPLCEECKRKGILRAAECVDHIDPWPICEDYFFDRRNLQALCNKCNIEKGNRDKARISEWRRQKGEGVEISPRSLPDNHSPGFGHENAKNHSGKIE